MVLLNLIVILFMAEVEGQPCPRNPGVGQTCVTEQCSTQDDCSSPNTYCIYDGYCGMSCINPSSDCPEAEDIDNGMIRYSVSTRVYNSFVMYDCVAGYYLSGMSTRRCQGDRTWGGTRPECETQDDISDTLFADPDDGDDDNPRTIVGCVIPQVNNGRVVGLPQLKPGSTRSNHGDHALAVCSSGHSFRDGTSLTVIVCNDSSWNSTAIQCHPSTRTCLVPDPLPGGVIPYSEDYNQILPADTINEGETILLDCEDVNRRVARTCTSNGWSNEMVPDCSVTCLTPDLPSRNIKIYNNMETEIREHEEVPVGDRIELHCVNNILHVNWECTIDGWSQQRFPDCFPGCTRPTLAEHTLLSTNKAIYEEHEVITVSCDPGFVQIGADPRIQCESSGSWNISRRTRHRCELLDISIEESPQGGYRGIQVTCTVSNTFTRWPVYISVNGSYSTVGNDDRSSTTTVFSSRFYYRQNAMYACVAHYGTRPVFSRTISI